MSETKSELEVKLEEIEQSLGQVTEIQDGITKLKQIEQLLAAVKMDNIYNIKDLIIKHLKPVTRDITNISMRDLPDASRDILQQLTFAIVGLYAKAARFRFEILAFELLPELLDRRADLFRTNVGRTDKVLALEEEKALYQLVQSDWIMRKSMCKQENTPFYYKCLTLVMTTMEGVEKQFPVAGLNFVKEYINFLIKMSTYLNINKLTDHVEKILESLQNMMENNPTSKQFNMDTIKLMFNSENRLCNICMKGDLRKRFEMLGSTYGLGMLSSPSIQKKTNGIKLINKEAESFYRGNGFVKEEQYINWLYNNKIIELILEQSSQSPILKHCNYILRILFKKHCLNTANLQKIFDYVEQASSQNRQIVLKNLDLESIRLEYYDYELLVSFIKKPFKPDFYEEDLFSICSQCIRYSTTNLLKEFITELSKILESNIGKFRNEKIEQKCLKCFVKAVVRLLDKDLNSETKKSEFLKLYDHYFEKEFNNLGIMVFKAIFDELPEISQISTSKAASALISNKSVIQNGLKAMKDSTNKSLTANIQQFLCLLLRKAGDVYGSQKIEFTPKIFIEAVHSSKMFEKLSTFVPYNSQQLLETFEALLNMFNVEKIPFECVRSIFLRMNFIYVREVREYNQEYRFETLGKVTSLKGVDSLKYLLMTASNAENRSAIASFISDIYTNFSESRAAEAEIQLEKMLEDTLKMTLMEYGSKQSAQRLLGSLALVEAFMMGTETLGVGKYRPHNSLVPISTVQIKVMNDITYGNDVSQSYWKKVSSNLTLFDLLEEMCEKFRCSACQISLQEGEKFWSEKLNGLTLEETKIDDKLLKAVKSSKERIRKQKLIQNNELTAKAKKVFEQIYKSYASEGKMGKKQCSNFVAGVTKTSSSIHDARVIEFFKDYDLDQDENITVEDFLKFYLYHCAPEREEIVWKNLNNMRYRKDLKKYDDPVEITNQNLLYRSLLSKSVEFYEMLFALSEQKNEDLKQISIKLLLRLPTFSKTLESLKSELDLISKNCFQTEYLLIAVQSKLALKSAQEMPKSEINREQFIQSGNSIKIFEMMVRIDKMQKATKDQMKCLYISLQILRSLIKVPDLRTVITAGMNLDVNMSFPETYLFIKLAESALKNIEIDILEASLALQMSQKEKKIEFALEGIFHQELGIRKTCCNYILALYLQGSVSIDLFTIEQKANCEYWFETLAKICSIDTKIDFSKVISSCLQKIRNRFETIESNQDDPIVFGNLSIVSSVLQQRAKNYDDISSDIIEISQHVLSNRSRRLIYQILAHFDVYFAIQYVTSLIENITPVKEVEPKKHFVGIKNLGSTCYMNSVLQVLFCVDQFRNLVLHLDKSQKKEMTEVKGKLICDDTLYQLQAMYTSLMRSSRKFYVPQEFCLTIKQNGSSTEPIDPKVQEDAHEFVGKFLDKLEKEIQKTDKIEYFRRLIEGNTTTQVLCKKCSNKISREQKFCQLSLAVQGNKNLQESFQNYIKPEEIEDYFCTNCNCKVDKIEKSTQLQKLPKLLTINLQRIIFDLENFVNKKIDTTFEFPVNLNVYNYVSKEAGLAPQECDYTIKAIIVHSGTSESGHYYAFIRVDKDWYKFNDQTVTKIDYKDIHHECFGGSESKEQWTDDMKFSTNAYMLFYESKSQHLEDIPCSLNEDQVEKIEIDNQRFYKQAQIHQQSVFLFANELFERFVPRDIEQRMKFSTHDQGWNDDANLSYYEAIYEFSIKVLRFSTVFYDVKSEYVFKIGQNLFKLFFLLPQKSYSFLTSLSPDEAIDNLCIHNDDTIRSIYKYLLNKSLHVFICYYQATLESEEEGTVKVIKLIDTLFAFLEDERFDKNIGKCFHYLDFWKTCCEFMPVLVDYLITHECLVILVDKLMGNDSPLADNKKKRVEISQYVVTPIIQIVVYLMSRKKNMKGYINPLKVFDNLKYYEMTENEKLLLSNTEFYSKMINKRYDSGQLGLVTARLSEKDFQFSKEIGGIYLKGLNNASNSDSAIIILHHIQHYLLLDDELSADRIKWILGIPQLHMGDELVYGLAYEDESVAYDYVSPLLFVKSAQKQENKSALSIMYQNHSTFSDFSVKGVALLLDLMCTSSRVFDYVLSIPAPTYMFRSYLDWIEKYIRCFKDSYIMEDRIAQKVVLVDKMNEMYKHLSERIATSGIILPVNKNIIGRNKELNAVESVYDQNYKMTLWAHMTYILKNEPLLMCNGSLPKEMFKFGHPEGIAKYFISMDKFSELIDSEDIAAEYTVYTLEIDSKQLLKLDIKLEGFKQQLNVHKGKIFINFPYQEAKGGLKEVVDVTVIKKEQQMQMVEKMEKEDIEATDKELLDYYATESKPTITCKQCTFINKCDERFCEMCMNALY